MAQVSRAASRKLRQRVTERSVSRLWREEAPRVPWLTAQDGQRLRVLYPGMPASGPGPDFRDALLMSPRGSILRGDVEVHLRPEGWQAHGHSRDRRYNGVVLHVVLWPSAPSLEHPLELGLQMPVLALFPVLDRLRRRGKTKMEAPPPPSPWRAPSPAGLGGALDRAGDARFRERAAALSLRMADCPAEEVLYQGLMEALGYSRNREPMLATAQGLPLRFLRRAVAGAGAEERLLHLQALLLGAGGWLSPAPTARGGVGEPFPAALQTCWGGLGLPAVVERSAWCLHRIRPENRPARRLAGMAHLLGRFWGEGLLQGLVLQVGACAGQSGGPRGALDALVIPASGYWEGHLDLGVAVRRGPALIGDGRAGEMAVNSLLPFCFALGRRTRARELARAALDLFHAWPASPDNELLREAAATLLPRGAGACQSLLTSARRQQGLIHLYRQAFRAAEG
ncbi:MAG: DUF2851 family protein [Chloroflexi bacterium]|nr:DUF2851 family protein [Chloroflexota bacterium]